MTRILIVTPARPGSRSGNRHTAARWSAMLRSAGHRVSIGTEWNGERCDLLVALHAHRSHDSVRRYLAARPGAPVIVALTGTDLYRDLPSSRKAQASLDLADRIIVLQSEAKRALKKTWRRKTHVVYQSSDTKLRHTPPARPFRIAVIGHLRKVKDPFRTAKALRYLDGDYEVVQIGGALDEKMAPIARSWMNKEPRYRWLGSLPHASALKWIARSHVLVVSSLMEGGANVICEAARIGTPVLGSRMPGNVGMLGPNYPGYYKTGDERALSRLISTCRDATFYRQMKRQVRRRRPLFAASEERRSLLRAILSN